MKTLDEVINIFEKACDLEKRCEECDGCLSQEYGCPNDGAEAVPDALHYLREYRERQENLDQKVIKKDVKDINDTDKERMTKVKDLCGKWGHCECGADVFRPDENGWKYCPNCGARLEFE